MWVYEVKKKNVVNFMWLNLWCLPVSKIFGLLSWNIAKRFLMKRRNGFYQKMQFLSKNVANFSYSDYLDFRAYLGMKINDLLKIENIDTLCCHNFNDKTINIWYQISAVNWSFFELRVGLIFTHTATVKELMY